MGSLCFFWSDLWHGIVLSQEYPELHSFALDPFISVEVTKNIVPVHSLFHLLVSIEALTSSKMFSLFLTPCTCSLHPNGLIFGDLLCSPLVKLTELWWVIERYVVLFTGCGNLHVRTQNKRKFFFWLVLQDRLSTRDILQRKQMIL